MNKKEAINQIMEIMVALPKELQAKLIEAVRTLARFKMINVNDDVPCNHQNLILDLSGYYVSGRITNESITNICLTRTAYNVYSLDNMKKDCDFGNWYWEYHCKEAEGRILEWLPLSVLVGDQLMDELGNELIIE